MNIDRRTIIVSAVSAALARPMAAFSASTRVDRTMVIVDGLGSINAPSESEQRYRISSRAWSKMQLTGVTAFRDTIVPVGNLVDAWEQFQSVLRAYQRYFRANPDRLTLVKRAADILAAKSAGKMGVILGTQDTAMIGPALDRLGVMRKGGIRCVQLTYNNANLSGDGAIEPRNAGLSDLGRNTIRQIEREKLLLDLAHGGARTIEESIAFAQRPLTISHTDARAITDHPRNVSDAAIRGVAEKGGVIGVYFMPYLAENMRPSGPTLLDHIEHIAKVAGEDHVAIGTDGGVLPLPINAKAREVAKETFRQRTAAGIAAPGEGPDVFTVVEDYNSVDKFKRLAADLGRRGWTQSRIEKLLGRNLLRLYNDVWDT